MHPITRKIIAGGAKYSAVDTFEATYKLQALQQLAAAQLEVLGESVPKF